jgi:hypothetical protein
MRRLPILSNSEEKTWRACVRKHHYAYRLLARPIRKSKPMRFGTLIHHGLEKWWKTAGDLYEAIVYMRAKASAETDGYELAAAEALLIGYHARWVDELYEPLAVERMFEAPLVHPVTGQVSQHFVHGGKIDFVAKHHPSGEIHLGEHKTSAEDIEMGSQYWQRLRLDTQVSKYFVGARALGFDVTKCLYDVLRRPGQEPRLATPIELRKYTKVKPPPKPKAPKKPRKSKKGEKNALLVTEDGLQVVDIAPEPAPVPVEVPRLYANQRDTNETVEEFFDRVLADIRSRPSYYYARGFVNRLERDLREWELDTWKTALRIREGERDGHYPKNPDACSLYHRTCEYLPVCVGDAQIDDPYLYRRAGAKHEELEEAAE